MKKQAKTRFIEKYNETPKLMQTTRSATPAGQKASATTILYHKTQKQLMAIRNLLTKYCDLLKETKGTQVQVTSFFKIVIAITAQATKNHLSKVLLPLPYPRAQHIAQEDKKRRQT